MKATEGVFTVRGSVADVNPREFTRFCMEAEIHGGLPMTLLFLLPPRSTAVNRAEISSGCKPTLFSNLLFEVTER